MQPIVVKRRTWEVSSNTVNGYEVIDGQQRLTTLFILLKAITENKWKEDYPDFDLFDLTYESRQTQGSSDFLVQIDSPNADDIQNEYVDFFYMKMVFNTIQDWFKKNGSKSKITQILLDEDVTNNKDEAQNIRVIWYEVGENSATNDTNKIDSIEIFTRLNIGKIPLTNAELIKALLLRKSNFINSSEREIQLKQIQIAEEWDLKEQQLQNDAFWYFMYNTSNPLKYETRIEFIFDLMKEKNEDDGYSYTFEKFNEEFDAILSDKGNPVDKIWNEIKIYFRILEYWYQDRQLFHYIGFLVETGKVKLLDLIKLYQNKKIIDERTKTIVNNPDVNKDEDKTGTFSNSPNIINGLSKKEFLVKIKKLVYLQVKDIDLDKLKYENNETKMVLLLFNVLTVLESDRSDLKFPFEKYKKENWDKEHIASNTEKEFPIDDKKRIDWINDMIFYFTEERIPKDADDQDYTDAIDKRISEIILYDNDENKEKLEILQRLKELKKNSKDETIKKQYTTDFKELYKKLSDRFEEDRISQENKDFISNMALLNATINRSYGNAFFAIKRQFIKENDSSGVFVPIATKNAFMKYYSTNVNNMMCWTKEDANAYLKAIKEKINTLK